MKVIDYGKYVNNFDRNVEVQSLLIYGDLDKVKTPFISVVIPTYKRLDTLKQTIESAVNQEDVRFEYEIIIVDNDPKISSKDIEDFIKDYNCTNIYYYKNTENIGMIGNWNRCIELARGEWISFLHDDDLLKPNCLTITEKIIRKDEKRKRKTPIGYIKFNVTPFYGSDAICKLKSNVITRKDKIQGIFGIKLIRVRNIDFIIYGGSGNLGAPTCGTLIKKEAIIDVGGYNVDLYPSADAYPPVLMLKKYRVYKTIIELGYYRWDINSSFKKEILFGWVQDFCSFYKYMEKTYSFHQIFIKIFQNEQYALFIQYILKLTEKKDLGLNTKDFDAIYKYKPNRTKLKVLLIIKRIYYYFKLIITFFFG